MENLFNTISSGHFLIQFSFVSRYRNAAVEEELLLSICNKILSKKYFALENVADLKEILYLYWDRIWSGHTI